MKKLRQLKQNRRWEHLIFTWALLLVLTACDGAKKGASTTGKNPSTTTPPRKVQTTPVTERPLERTIPALGSLLAYQQATLSAKVPGRLQSIPIDLGSMVQKGDLLAQIEPRDYQLKVQQAQAALAQARAALGLPLEDEQDEIDPDQVSAVKETRAILDEAKTNLDRIQQLSREKIISDSQVDAARSSYLVALNRHQDTREKARQQQSLVTQRRVELELAKQQLADTTLVAPFEGGIQERQADTGEYLTIGSPVATLVQLNPLRLRVEVSERDTPKVRLGQCLRFRLEGDTNLHPATIQRLSPALNEGTRMLTVEADVANDGRFHPGCFASTEIVIDPESPALTIPTNAVIVFAGLEKVFVVNSSKAVEKRIATGKWTAQWVEVTSGLAIGEEVILDPGNLQAGQPVVKEP